MSDFDSPRRCGLPGLGQGALSDLRTFGLTKAYGTTEAFCGVDLEVPAGVVYGLVGPNGSGKMTALEILAGLRHLGAGRIELGVPRDLVAYCPDDGTFEPWLTAVEVLDVAALSLAVIRLGKRELYPGGSRRPQPPG